ncbi:8598_t:CDS:2 [Funneliformis geosporum]|uniref:8598_t:CDS:1 n=1 Tax=Funneliformis geosporum TaxID=1117311 RepID=A0A9W4T7P9_9GLOM|nr:8598_t:CDS:2 [Funneliformis geosporum]
MFHRIRIDIYYPEYGFAIEVQGVQHKKYIKFFHNGDPNNFIKQQTQDQFKKELCEENQIAPRIIQLLSYEVWNHRHRAPVSNTIQKPCSIFAILTSSLAFNTFRMQI